MAETRTFNPDGSLKQLVVDNRDKELNLQLEDLSRQIPNDVASIEYKELDSEGVVVKTIARTREQLLNAVDTYSFVYDYAYYGTGEIDTIRTSVFDASEPPVKLQDRILKHYTDGKQPEFL